MRAAGCASEHVGNTKKQNARILKEYGYIDLQNTINGAIQVLLIEKGRAEIFGNYYVDANTICNIVKSC